jgi:chaperonin cofactor prefoldin
MQHLKHTLSNIVSLLGSEDKEGEGEGEGEESGIYMEIAGFDDRVETVLENTRITQDQIEKIHDRIQRKLQSRGSTNIELALNTAKVQLKKQQSKDTHFIFMTDGNITTGCDEVDILKQSLLENTHNYFIGFGMDHDYALLQGLASDQTNPNSQYYYVDAVENAGFVFGEIVHTILHPALKSGKIAVESGEIYDFNDGQWKREILLPILCEDACKHYHVRSSDPDTFKMELTGIADELPINIMDHAMPGLIIMDENGNETELENVGNDLTIYVFRQRSLELLFQAQAYMMNKSEMSQETIQQRLKTLRDQMKDYCTKITEIESSTHFMKQLMDDLYICSKKLNSRRGLLFINTRLYTQGREGSYNITDIDEDDDVDSNQDDDYRIERCAYNRANTTPQQINTMRSCSQTYNDDIDIVDIVDNDNTQSCTWKCF